MSEELKACPFCGKKVKLENFSGGNFIMCRKSSCGVNPCTDYYYDNKEDAMRVWNRRAND